MATRSTPAAPKKRSVGGRSKATAHKKPNAKTKKLDAKTRSGTQKKKSAAHEKTNADRRSEAKKKARKVEQPAEVGKSADSSSRRPLPAELRQRLEEHAEQLIDLCREWWWAVEEAALHDQGYLTNGDAKTVAILYAVARARATSNQGALDTLAPSIPPLGRSLPDSAEMLFAIIAGDIRQFDDSDKSPEASANEIADDFVSFVTGLAFHMRDLRLEVEVEVPTAKSQEALNLQARVAKSFLKELQNRDRSPDPEERTKEIERVAQNMVRDGLRLLGYPPRKAKAVFDALRKNPRRRAERKKLLDRW